MKTNYLLPLGLATLASSLALEKRQGLSGVAKMIPAIDPLIIQAKPLLRPDAKRQLLRFGPFTLPAYSGDAPAASPHDMAGMGMGAAPSIADSLTKQKPMDPNGFTLTRRVGSGFCKNCTVFAGRSTAVWENGTRADIAQGIYLHHLLALDVTKPSADFLPGCAKNTAVGRGAGAISVFLGGAVDEFTQYYTTPDGKFPSGYYVKDNTFLLQMEIVNYHKTPQNIFVQVDVEYADGKVGEDARQGQMGSMPCDNALRTFNPKQNSSGTISSDPYPVTQDGTLLAIRGHVHDGGTGLTLIHNNVHTVCDSVASYSDGKDASSIVIDGKQWNTITKMSECPGPIVVKKGDTLKVVGGWDTVKHPLRESHGKEQEGMGVLSFVFVPKE